MPGTDAHNPAQGIEFAVPGDANALPADSNAAAHASHHCRTLATADNAGPFAVATRYAVTLAAVVR